jgi:hypothetical protein
MTEPVSRGRGEITEITHIAPIRKGLVPVKQRDSAPITYVDRLKTILEAFHRREDTGFPSVIRMFRGIHSAQWALLDGDSRLMLNVVFDGDWSDYLRSLAFDVPAFLHLIWSNCEGWQDVTGDPEQLFSFIKAYQVRVSFLYAHHPSLTVRDVDWLEHLRKIAQDGKGDSISRAELLRSASVGLEAKPMDVRRAELLKEYEARARAANTQPPRSLSPLGYAQYAFVQVIKPLYESTDFKRAYVEAFGEEPTTPQIGGTP